MLVVAILGGAAPLNAEGVNDAPTVTAPTGFAVTEDVAGNLTYTGTPFADIDSSTLTVTLSVSDGTISGNTGTGITVGGTATARTFSGTVPDLNTYFATAGKITYQGALNNTENRILTTTVSDGSLSASTASIITFTAVNSAPVASGTATLDPIQEDGEGSLVGQTIQNLFSTNFSDAADGNQAVLAAIAITAHAIDSTRGAWQYSTDGQNWIAVPASPLSAAFILNASDRLRFVPVANYNGLATPLEARLVESGGVALVSGESINLSSNGPQVSLSGSSVIGWSSKYSTSFSPDRVLDNQSGSVSKDIFGNNYWLAANQSATGYFIIDLGVSTDLSRAELYNTSNTGHNDRGTVNFHIEVASSISGNGAASYVLVNPKTAVAGTLIPAVVGVAPVAQTFSLQTDGVTPRYVRFVVDSSRYNNPGLNEIRLFAKSEIAGGASSYSVAAVPLVHTITAMNDAPVATAQTVTTDEDTAKVITLAGMDVEGSALTYAVVTQPTKGVLSGTAPNLTYTPNANVNGGDSFTFQVNDGAMDSVVAPVSISIAAMNDEPTLGTPNAISLLDTVASDSFTELKGTLSDVDVDSATLVYGILNGTVVNGVATKVGTYGTLTVTVATGAYTFTPNASAINALSAEASESYTVTVADNGGLSATANFGVSITGVNDAPVLNASQGPTQATEQVAVVVDGGITVSDADNAILASVTVTLSGGYRSGEDVLGYVNNPQAYGNISGSFDASSGVLTLTSVEATATLAQWQEALRSVTYLNTSDTPNTSARTVAVMVNDRALASAAVTKTVSLTAVPDVVSVGGLTAASKVYNGTRVASVSGTPRLVGVSSGADVQLQGTPVFTLAQASVGTAVTIQVSGLTLAGAQAAEYTLVLPQLVGDITPQPISINGLSGVTKVYDGTTAATVSGTATLSGVVSSDESQVILSGTPVFTFASANVGMGIAISATEYTVSGSKSGNYTLTQPSGLTGTITAKALSIGAPTIASKVYDGTTAAGAVTVGALSGLVGFETLTVTGTAAAYGSAAVGTYSGVAVTYTLANSGSDNTVGLASNYSLTPGSATGAITAAALLITADSLSLIQDYDGKSHAILWSTQPAGISVKVLYGGSPTAPHAAGTYEVKLSSMDPNFSGALTVTLTVRKTIQGIKLIGGVVVSGLQPVDDGVVRYSIQATLGQPIAGSMVVVSGVQLSTGFWFTDQWDQALNLVNIQIPTAEVADKGIVTLQTSASQSSSISTSKTQILQVASSLRLPETRMTVVPVPYLLRVRIQISGTPGARWKVQSLDGLHSENWQDADLLALDSNGTGSIETDAGTDSGMRFYRLVRP